MVVNFRVAHTSYMFPHFLVTRASRKEKETVDIAGSREEGKFQTREKERGKDTDEEIDL